MPIYEQFQEKVIAHVALSANGRNVGYANYLSEIPAESRTGDEANAVDQQFSRYVLEWLGFTPADWTYNQPVEGRKSDKPDYVVRGTVGVAFIWENKNSTLSLEDKHVGQMRRYATGTGGYAVWCNMRRILAVRFTTGDTHNYDIVTDVDVERLYGVQTITPDERAAQEQNLSLLHLLFGRERFTQFAELVARVARPEADFLRNARSLSERNALRQFIADSRQSLDHLRLAALSQIRDAVARDDAANAEETNLRAEWDTARTAFVDRIGHNGGSVQAALDKLIPGETDRASLARIEVVAAQARGAATLPATLRVLYDQWLARAERINAALRNIRFTRRNTLRIAEAYRAFVSNQRDPEDARPETFAEQVAYVFFVRLLLVRVLEDKRVLPTRIASDGGFAGWVDYLHQHFGELDGISILNENYCGLLNRKAGSFYLHFFQQPVFDWFIPDDYLLVETLEFLCRYNFESVASDIIGFTYEEYIDRNARNRKGHFLTRPEVVDYMLDLLGYSGTEVIGQRVLDPACGSGSFLVHAARRYRAAVVAALCQRERLPEDEGSLAARPELRRELARTFITGLTENFHGMEINPFSCYLAEMNLLIQALDDLAYLQRDANDTLSIERFRVFNTNSLELPYAVLHADRLAGDGTNPTATATDYLSERITDEAFPLKAKLDDFAGGFPFIIFNPPYVSSKREEIGVQRLRSEDFFASVLSGDANLFLFFLKLAAYYLADHGRTVFIIPLTIFGDRSSAAARRLLRTAPLAPSAAIRFYRGDVLFPGVDQAVGIVRVERSVEPMAISVAGGDTVMEVKENQYELTPSSVLDAVPGDAPWNGAWLVSSDPIHAAVWEKAKEKSLQLALSLGSLVNAAFAARQGDVNASDLRPYIVKTAAGYDNGHLGVYGGKDVLAFAPIATIPPNWAKYKPTTDVALTNRTLHRIAELPQREVGVVRRQVARLNTRERFLATWFERDASAPYIFTHATWRMILRAEIPIAQGKALLALIGSRSIAFLFNLFSSNNNISGDDFDRIPVPDSQTFPVDVLARLSDEMLSVRSTLNDDFLKKYQLPAPDRDSDNEEDAEESDVALYLPPAAVLATDAGRRKTTLGTLALRGVLQNTGADTARFSSLNRGNRITITPPAVADPAAAAEALRLFLSAPALQTKTWAQAQNEPLPEPVAAAAFLAHYRAETAAARTLWRRFLALQDEVDSVVCDWYEFDAGERAAIAAGLPWARRRATPPTPANSDAAPDISRTERELVASSLVAAIGYDETAELLEVELTSGEVYGYALASPELVAAFRAADSKGSFYNDNIKGVLPRSPLV